MSGQYRWQVFTDRLAALIRREAIHKGNGAEAADVYGSFLHQKKTEKIIFFEMRMPYQQNNGMKSRDYKNFRELFR